MYKGRVDPEEERDLNKSKYTLRAIRRKEYAYILFDLYKLWYFAVFGEFFFFFLNRRIVYTEKTLDKCNKKYKQYS